MTTATILPRPVALAPLLLAAIASTTAVVGADTTGGISDTFPYTSQGAFRLTGNDSSFISFSYAAGATGYYDLAYGTDAWARVDFVVDRATPTQYRAEGYYIVREKHSGNVLCVDQARNVLSFAPGGMSNSFTDDGSCSFRPEGYPARVCTPKDQCIGLKGESVIAVPLSSPAILPLAIRDPDLPNAYRITISRSSGLQVSRILAYNGSNVLSSAASLTANRSDDTLTRPENVQRPGVGVEAQARSGHYASTAIGSSVSLHMRLSSTQAPGVIVVCPSTDRSALHNAVLTVENGVGATVLSSVISVPVGVGCPTFFLFQPDGSNGTETWIQSVLNANRTLPPGTEIGPGLLDTDAEGAKRAAESLLPDVILRPNSNSNNASSSNLFLEVEGGIPVLAIGVVSAILVLGVAVRVGVGAYLVRKAKRRAQQLVSPITGGPLGSGGAEPAAAVAGGVVGGVVMVSAPPAPTTGGASPTAEADVTDLEMGGAVDLTGSPVIPAEAGEEPVVEMEEP